MKSDDSHPVDNLTSYFINKHMRTKCGRKKKWYVKGVKYQGQILGTCSACGKIVENYSL